MMITACSSKSGDDTTAPVITITGKQNPKIMQYGMYIELSAKAVDDKDGNVSVTTKGNIDTSLLGKQTIEYSATDSSGNTATKIKTVEVVKADSLIQEMRDRLNDDTIPFTTDADFNKTEYAKNHMPEDKSRRLTRAHTLVASAVDPDPEWFATKVDKSFSMVSAGDSYTVKLDKQKKDGTTIGPVDNEKLRLVIRVQRSKNIFEYITQNDTDQYAEWSADGVLEVHVPDDLTQGRLLIGIRPNFDDVATSAIAERWSTVITAEVVNIKKDTKVVDTNTIVFPLEDNGKPVFATGSKFTKSDIAPKTKEFFEKNKKIILPIVVRNMNIKNGDMISYILMGRPYSGKVISLETRKNQQFALLSPELFEVYDVVDINENFMVKEGLYPENVIYREGGSFVSDTNESDITRFSKMTKEVEDKKFFKRECTSGKAFITFNKGFSFSPLNLYVDVTMHALNPNVPVECEWKAEGDGINLTKSLYHGPVGWAAKALGAGITVKPTGSIALKLKTPSVLGMEMGYSYINGAHHKIISGFKDDLEKSRNLNHNPIDGTAGVSGSLGVQTDIILVGKDSFVGYILDRWVDIQIEDLGLEGVAKVKAALAANIYNASKVKSSDKSSSLSFKVDGELSLKPTDAVVNFFKYYDSSLKLELNLPMNFVDEKIEAKFSYVKVDDDGLDEASVEGLRFHGGLLNTIFSGSSAKGVLAPVDTGSSTHNDKTESIEYDVVECPDDLESPLIVPAIGCFGWVCGKFDRDVELCANFDVPPAIASARVGEEAKTTITIQQSGDKEQTIEITGTPLEPKDRTITIPAHGTQTIELSKTCSNETGVKRKETKLVTSDGTVLDTADNIMLCYEDENLDRLSLDPHIVTGDKLGYDYYASGDYVLSRINGVDDYEVQVRFLPGYETSWPQAVALRVGGDTIEIHGQGMATKDNSLKIYINGIPSKENSTKRLDRDKMKRNILLPSGGIIAITGIKTSRFVETIMIKELTILWPKESKAKAYGLIVRVGEDYYPFVNMQLIKPDTFAGKERGLLGNNDGDPTNDFIRRNGQVLSQDDNLSFTELYGLFGADWLVRPYESLFRNPEAVKPEFPDGVVTLTPEQRALGEAACVGLRGFYRKACIIDVGLTGFTDLVKEYYADTDDLNELSDAIITPHISSTHYRMTIEDKVLKSDSDIQLHYTQEIHVTHESGSGNFMLLTRPPKAATVLFETGKTSYTGKGNYTTSIEVNCVEHNETNNVALYSESGSLQLWLQDPILGTAQKMISEITLPCQQEDVNISSLKDIYIYVAESNETDNIDFINLFNPKRYPILHNSKLYMYHRTTENNTTNGGYDPILQDKVVSYDLSSFNSSMPMANLPTQTIYDATVHTIEYENHFSQWHYNFAEDNGNLYFTTLVENMSATSQNTLFRYDIDNGTEIYHTSHDNYTHGDLTKGWLIPMNDTKMAVVEKGESKVLNISDGSSIKYSGDDYISGKGWSSGSDAHAYPPVANSERYFDVYSLTQNYSKKLVNITFLADAANIADGVRDVNMAQYSNHFNNPNYKVIDIEDSFKAKYTGDHNYSLASGFFSNMNGAKLVLDNNDTLYMLAEFNYDNNESIFGFATDLYLLEYDMNSTLKELTLLHKNLELDGAASKFNKYKDTIYYTYGYRDDRNREHIDLCAFNVKTKKEVFAWEITRARHEDDSGISSSTIGKNYVITGQTIVVPRKVATPADPNYNIVFDIIDINSGEFIVSAGHNSLTNLNNENSLSFNYSLSDEDAVYYVMKRDHEDYDHDLIVKIKVDSYRNTVQKSRQRYDKRYSGMIEQN